MTRKLYVFFFAMVPLVLAGLFIRVPLRQKALRNHVLQASSEDAKYLVKPLAFDAPTEIYPGVSPMGYLDYYISFGAINFGQHMQVPSGLLISSQPGTSSSILGQFCCLPFAEAYAQRLDDHTITFMLPGGDTDVLFRVSDSALDEYRSSDKLWRGVVNGRDLEIRRLDGWDVKYVSGMISEMRTPGNRVFHWARRGKDVEIKEEGIDEPLVRTTTRGTAINLVINNQHFVIHLRASSALSDNLAIRNISFPDGSEKSFDMTGAAGAPRQLTISNGANLDDMIFTWDTSSGYILSDNNWTYSVTDVAYGGTSFPTIVRKERRGMVQEQESFDPLAGILTKKGSDGKNEATYLITSPGPAFARVRKIESLDARGNATNSFAAEYDPEGRPLRVWDPERGELLYKYDTNGHMTSCVQNGKTIMSSRYDEKDRLLYFFDGNTQRTFNIVYKSNGKATLQYLEGTNTVCTVLVNEAQVRSISQEISSTIQSIM